MRSSHNGETVLLFLFVKEWFLQPSHRFRVTIRITLIHGVSNHKGVIIQKSPQIRTQSKEKSMGDIKWKRTVKRHLAQKEQVRQTKKKTMR